MLLALIVLISVHAAAAGASGGGSNHLGALLQQVHVGDATGSEDTLGEQITNAYIRKDKEFACSALTCKASLYVPGRSIDGSGKAPVIVMAHGLGGDKAFLDKYASVFAENGFAVFSFDYRYWGESAGEPRRWISTSKQVQDWLSAIRHVQNSLSDTVDTGRMSLWGTSYGGGHVINMASKLGKQVKAVVAQVSLISPASANDIPDIRTSFQSGHTQKPAEHSLHQLLHHANLPNLHAQQAGALGPLMHKQRPTSLYRQTSSVKAHHNLPSQTRRPYTALLTGPTS